MQERTDKALRAERIAIVLLTASVVMAGCGSRLASGTDGSSGSSVTDVVLPHLQASQMAFVSVSVGGEPFTAINEQVKVVDSQGTVLTLTPDMVEGSVDAGTVGDYAVELHVTDGQGRQAVIQLTVTVKDDTLDMEGLLADLGNTFWLDDQGRDGWYISFSDDDEGGSVFQYTSVASGRYLFEAPLEGLDSAASGIYVMSGTGRWYDQQSETVSYQESGFRMRIDMSRFKDGLLAIELDIDMDRQGIAGLARRYILAGADYEQCQRYYLDCYR